MTCFADPCPGCSNCDPLVKASPDDARFGEIPTLQSAIVRLGAVEVAPNLIERDGYCSACAISTCGIALHQGLYALDDDETPKSWYVATAQGLLWLDREQRFPDDNEQVGVVRIKPKWWTPGQRYATYMPTGRLLRAVATVEAAERLIGHLRGYRIVTADLETGQEVNV
jgi:hypothetical protein